MTRHDYNGMADEMTTTNLSKAIEQAKARLEEKLLTATIMVEEMKAANPKPKNMDEVIIYSGFYSDTMAYKEALDLISEISAELEKAKKEIEFNCHDLEGLSMITKDDVLKILGAEAGSGEASEKASQLKTPTASCKSEWNRCKKCNAFDEALNGNQLCESCRDNAAKSSRTGDDGKCPKKV